MFENRMFDEPDWGVSDSSTYDDEEEVPVDEYDEPEPFQAQAMPQMFQQAPPAERRRPVPPPVSVPTVMPGTVLPTVMPVARATGEFSPDARKGAGVGLLLVAVGGCAGAALGGLYGAAAGVLGIGSIRNAYRATKLWPSENPEDRKEAGLSATTAGFGLLGAGFLIYQAYKKRNP